MSGSADGRTWYQVMGLASNASASEIRAAYLRLARNLHPDRHAEGSESERGLAERRMREVNAAWAVLGDESAKSTYDVELRLAQVRATAPPRRPDAPPPPPSSPRPTVPAPFGGASTVPPRHHRFDGKVIEDDPGADDVELTKGQYFLLRRVPILVAVAVAAALLIGSALARGDDGPTPSTTVVTVTTTAP